MKTLEIGKSYRTRGTAAIWVVTGLHDGNFQARSFNRKTTFTPDGHYYFGSDDEDDLIIPQDDLNEIPHLEVILGIAQGKVCEFLGSPDKWNTPTSPEKLNPVSHPHLRWRIKPEKKTIKIGDAIIVAPETEKLAVGQQYYVSLITHKAVGVTWENDSVDYRRLNNGVIYLTEADVQAANAAIIKLLTGK